MENEGPFYNKDPFYIALQAIEPNYPVTQAGAGYSIDRAAALVGLPPRLLRAWVRGDYEFSTFKFNYEEFRVIDFIKKRTTVMGREGVYRLKKCLEKEPRPYPPLQSRLRRYVNRSSPNI